MENPSSGLPLRSYSYLLLESHFTILRASEMKAGAKNSLLLHPLHPGRYIDTNDQDSIKNTKLEILPSLPQLFACSHTSGLAGPSVPSLITGPLTPIAPTRSCPLHRLSCSSALLLRTNPPFPRFRPRCRWGWVRTRAAS